MSLKEEMKAAEYLQCSDCDFIGIPERFRYPETDMYLCPSCSSDDLVIVDVADFYLSREQIGQQIEWQKEILVKGPITAMVERFLKPRPAEGSDLR